MTRRKRDELRENVIIAARGYVEADMRMTNAGDDTYGQASQTAEAAFWQLREATNALEAHEAAAITGSGARSVKGAPETSAAAAGLAEPTQYSTRWRIARLLSMHESGDTDDELEQRMGGRHQTVSSARNWLVEAGWVRDSGQRRKTRSNRMAVVWELTPAAHQQLTKGGTDGRE